MAKNRNVSSIVSGTDVAVSIAHTLVSKARERGLTDEDLHQLATHEGEILIGRFVDILEENRRKQCQAKSREYLVIVQCGELTLVDMVKVGRYKYVDPYIKEEWFQIGKETYWAELILVHFGREMTSEQVEIELGKQGLRAGKIEELLAFGKKYHNMQLEFPIICLGSSALISGSRGVPYLLGSSDERCLNLTWNDDAWDDGCRFLAVRK